MTTTNPPARTALAVNTIKMLAVDAVEQAKSGHPGMPMGAAHYAFTLWARYLHHNPKDPAWPNRDRFVLSAGHGSMLLYALLHLSGYDLPLEELQRFRQLGSRTPGHPEYGVTPGVETTTGPLGQGIANAVGMAIAARMAAARYNTADHAIVDHYVYAIVGDGDLMEGVTAEAASLAGHLGLGNLIVFYDDNRITIEGSTDLTFTEDRAKRFEAYGWQVLDIDGHDCAAAAGAIEEAQRETERPTLIVARTRIAHGSPNKVDTASAHGEPLGAEEVAATRRALGWTLEPFAVPEEVRDLFARRAVELERDYRAWQDTLRAWAAANPALAAERERDLCKALPDDLEEQLLASLPVEPNATRRLSGTVLQKVAEIAPYVVGGSADLAPSTSTLIQGAGDVGPGAFAGRNLRFGVREHGMGAILNGMALYGGFIPYGATFLSFVDYMRPPIRLACLMGVQVIYVLTHDSIFVGEDGPTHQPVEQIASLRLLPRMTVLRPADGPEVAAAWALALRYQTGPTALILTRQGVPAIARDRPFDLAAFNRGGYIVGETPERSPDVVLVATGSELHLAVETRALLEEAGYAVRVVSLPCRARFLQQSVIYRAEVIPPAARKVVIEAGVRFGWDRVVGPNALCITQEDYGASAPAAVLREAFGFTPEKIAQRVLAWLQGA